MRISKSTGGIFAVSRADSNSARISALDFCESALDLGDFFVDCHDWTLAKSSNDNSLSF